MGHIGERVYRDFIRAELQAAHRAQVVYCSHCRSEQIVERIDDHDLLTYFLIDDSLYGRCLCLFQTNNGPIGQTKWILLQGILVHFGRFTGYA